MRINVIFVIGTTTSLRARWLLDLRYAEIAAALCRRYVQTAKVVYFGRRVQEAVLPLTLSEGELPSVLPSLGYGNNLDKGLQAAHRLAGTTPSLVVVIDSLIDVADTLPARAEHANANIVQLFALCYDADGDHNEKLAANLAATPRTTVLLPTLPGQSASELDAFLTNLNRNQLDMSA